MLQIDKSTGAETSLGVASYYITDHLGNTRAVYSATVDCPAIFYTLEYAADYYPYGKTLREFVNGKVERFLSTAHERDQETGFDYRGARYYDSDIARFLSLDPLAEKYLTLSDYSYVAGNPLVFIDSDGKDIDVSALLKTNKNGDYVNPDKAYGFLEFAKSDEGISFLKQYAKRGQTIAGHTYNEDGIFHRENITLSYSVTYKNEYGGGTNYSMKKDKGLNIYVHFYSGGDYGTLNNTFNVAKTAFHESFIHAFMLTQDYVKDGKIDYDNVSEKVKSTPGLAEEHWHHHELIYQFYENEYKNGYEKGTSMWPAKAYRGLEDVKTSLGLKFTSKQIKTVMWDYSGGFENSKVGLGKNK